MRYFIIALLLLAGISHSYAKKPKVKRYKFVEQLPVAPFDIVQYLSENMRIYGADSSYHYRVRMGFAIDTNGYAVDIKQTDSVAVPQALVDEAVRVIGGMPRWQPGSQKGKPVKVYYALPINFKYDADASDTSSRHK